MVDNAILWSPVDGGPIHKDEIGRYAYPGDVGIDLPTAEDALVIPGQITDIPVGIRCHFPPGVWAFIIGRSSTERRFGLRALTGVIDNGYTGPLFIGVIPNGDAIINISAGTRLAQMLILPTTPIQIPFQYAAELPNTDRGAAGFGSSGTNHQDRK
jgi:dUTP pyrophosphatase